MSLVGKHIRFTNEAGSLEGKVVDKIIGTNGSTQYLVETSTGATLTTVPYYDVIQIVKEKRVIPEIREADRVNLNIKMPGVIPKTSWPSNNKPLNQSDL